MKSPLLLFVTIVAFNVACATVAMCAGKSDAPRNPMTGEVAIPVPAGVKKNALIQHDRFRSEIADEELVSSFANAEFPPFADTLAAEETGNSPSLYLWTRWCSMPRH